MLVGFCKISFDEFSSSHDYKSLKSICDKIRSRYGIIIRIADEFHKKDIPALNLILAANYPSKIEQTLTSIVELIERSGFGRVSSDDCLIEDFDAIFEQDFE